MTGHRGIPGDVDWGAPGADLLREELNDERGAGGTGGVMAIVVQTVTTCELCGAVDVRQGAEGHTPPVGWSEMVIRTRGVGAGWSNTGRPFDGVICPVCTERMAQCIAAWAAGWKLVRWKTSSAAEAGAARRVEQVAEAVVVQPTSSANLDGPHVHSWGPLKAIPPDGEQGRECSGCLEYQRERTDD